jgi:cytochrome P450
MERATSKESQQRVDLPILDPDFKADPYPIYDAMRNTGCSIVPVRLPSGVQAWLVIGYAVARELLKDTRLSKVSPHAHANQSGAEHSVFRHLLTLDPPEHTRLRALVAPEFSPRRMARLRPRIKAIAGRLVADILPRGQVDLIQTFALPLSLKVICELIGVPPSDQALVGGWSVALAAADLEDPALIPAIAKDLHDYLVSLAQSKREHPDDALFAALVATHDRGELSEAELTAMGFLLLVAGYETTVSLVGNGTLALLSDRVQWSKLCARGELAAGAVEELLRFSSPLEVSTARFATADIAIENVHIRAGEMVFIGLAAANRDPARFDDPGRLDIERDQAASHVAFGHGVHYCIGAALARIEGEIAFAELARHIPDLELDAPIADLRWKPGLIMRGLDALPVRVQRRDHRAAD